MQHAFFFLACFFPRTDPVASFAAFDNERAMEVVWIEYRDVPLRVFEIFEPSLASLIKLEHPALVKYLAGWADKKNRTFVFISEMVTGDLRNVLGKKVQMGPKGTLGRACVCLCLCLCRA